MAQYALYRDMKWISHRNDYPASGYPGSVTLLVGVQIDNKTPVTRVVPDAFGWRQPTNYVREVQGTFTHGFYISGLQEFEGQNGFVGKGYTAFSGFVGVPYTATPSVPDGLKANCVNKALAKLKRQNVNFAVAFGERKRTADLVIDTTRRIGSAVRAVRRLDVDAALRALGTRDRHGSLNSKRAEELWLQMVYGWRPMLSDVHGATTELLDRDNRFRNRYWCSVSQKLSDRSRGVRSGGFTIGNTILKGTYEQEVTTRHMVHVRLDYRLASPAIATAASLGITNPLDVAWELLPWSFVADWFIPIGSCLTALDAQLGWAFKGGSISTVTRQNNRTRYVPQTLYHDTAYYRTKSTSVFAPPVLDRRVAFRRTRYDDSPSPMVPRFSDDPFRGERVWNAIALLSQAFR